MEAALTVQVGQRTLERLEYKGQPVVTFAQVDEVHERPAGTALSAFHRNRERFIQGEDYFRLDFTEASQLCVKHIANPNGLTVLTESGYFMVAKTFTDDLAWRVQRELIRGYFRAKVGPNPLSPAEQLMLTAQALMNLERGQIELRSDVGSLRERVDVLDGQNGYMALAVYIKKNKYKYPGLETMKKMGARASAIMRDRGEDVFKIPNAQYGTINGYPEDVCGQVVAEFRLRRKCGQES